MPGWIVRLCWVRTGWRCGVEIWAWLVRWLGFWLTGDTWCLVRCVLVMDTCPPRPKTFLDLSLKSGNIATDQ